MEVTTVTSDPTKPDDPDIATLRYDMLCKATNDGGSRVERPQGDVRFGSILLQKSRLRARCDFANVLKRSPAIG
jgi:hypothetical protein